MKANICGIYKIENEVGQVYIGSANARQGIAKRWSNHLANLRNNRHRYNELQKSWNENPNNLKWEVLEECPSDISEEDLSEVEKQWIDYCNKVDGWTVINKHQNKITRRNPISDTTNFSKAQSGSRNGNCRLSEQEVFAIRQLYCEGDYTQAQLAERFKVSSVQISRIVNGKRWGCLEEVNQNAS